MTSASTGAGSWKERALRTASQVPWKRLGFWGATVTLGFSQIIFNVIQHNLDFYPNGAWFFASVIFFAQFAPLAVLFAVDSLLLKWKGDGRTVRTWRTVLITLLFLSLLRQIQVYYPDPFWALMAWIPLRPVLAALTLLLFLVALRFHRALHTYLAWMGLLAVFLTISFFADSDTFGRRGGPVSRPSPAPDQKLPDVVLVVFDELSAGVLEKEGAIDRDLFPNFAALAGESAWYTNATSNHLLTTEAFPTLLSGFLEPAVGTPTLFDRLPSEYNVLMRLGSSVSFNWIRRHSSENQSFRVYAWEEEIIGSPLQVPGYLLTTFSETPFSRSPFAPQPPVRLAPPIFWDEGGFEMKIQEDIEGLLVDLAEPATGPRFVFWHSFLPHFPFRFDAEGKEHRRPFQSFARAPGSSDSVMLADSARKGLVNAKDYFVEKVLENYKEQVRYVDATLGRIMKMLRTQERYEDTVLIVTSDHGLRTWGELEPESYPDAMKDHTPRIPLFIRGPKIPRGKYDRDIQHVDLCATILDSIGFPDAAHDTEGVSAFSKERPDRPKVFINSFIGHAPRRYEYDSKAGIWRWIKDAK